MNDGVKNEEATPKRGAGRPFEKGNPGRPKGSLNKATLFKNSVFDGIELAAKRLAKDNPNGGTGTVAEYIANMLADKDFRAGIIKIGSGMVPKELHAEVKVDRVSIVMGPDDDCKED